MKVPVQDEIRKLGKDIKKTINIMEVCGTHTMAVARSGIRNLLPENIRLLSGPGCPVCVTPQEIIDWTIELASQKDVIITTFGDMVRVPGTKESLEAHHPVIVYSARDVLGIAQNNSQKSVVFVGVGFETTSPTIAATILEAKEKNIKNFFVIPAFKLIPPALEFIASSPRVNVDGFILPGHVSTIIGSKPYEFLARKYNLPGCITGFEPVDILYGVKNILEQIVQKKAEIAIEYKRVVKPEGNQTAISILNRVFEPVDSNWRGIGKIPQSGLGLKKEFEQFDATKKFDIKNIKSKEPQGCICGEILLGVKSPYDCPLFGRKCIPGNPVGACMVSSEGACAAYYRYGITKDRRNKQTQNLLAPYE
ncbi:MAG: hydrogenase formation protein HypD [candidate division WOR-3 bacterium]|nr:hydrogenase formation protein HypD [candidate division WOR-3 bacterium]